MWTWKQRQGELWRGGERIATGYAGAGEGKNNPDADSIPRVGPPPRGVYKIVSALVDGGHMGTFVLVLEPEPGTEMHGRSGFCVHGDNVLHPGMASNGCIILSRSTRRLIWDSADYQLSVVSGDEPNKEQSNGSDQ